MAITTGPTGIQRNVTFICTIKSESATSVHFFLNGDEVDLTRDGSTFSGKATRTIGDTVDEKVTIKGFDGTEWSSQLDADCPDDPAKLDSGEGQIGGKGGAGFEKNVKVPANPCKKHDDDNGDDHK